MGVPLNQAIRVGAYVVRQHLAGRRRYPLVLMHGGPALMYLTPLTEALNELSSSPAARAA